jgi:carboxypeptidase C (cathepsin A)
MPCGTTTSWAVGLLVVAVLASQLHRATALRLLTPQNKRDLVTRLPDYPVPVEHYAGHVVVGSKRTTRVFYYFVPAQNRPTTSPIIVWMQNSLMCSSMVGLVYEHGPFRLKMLDKRTLRMQVVPNPHSWHKAANVVYVDAPGGES